MVKLLQLEINRKKWIVKYRNIFLIKNRMKIKLYLLWIAAVTITHFFALQKLVMWCPSLDQPENQQPFHSVRLSVSSSSTRPVESWEGCSLFMTSNGTWMWAISVWVPIESKIAAIAWSVCRNSRGFPVGHFLWSRINETLLQST